MTLLSRVHFNKTSPSGFTLIEMAVVMMISGIIIATMITLLPTFVKSDKIKENRTRMTKYDNALQGYIITHFRLPLADIDGDGFEEDGTAEEDAFGYLPYRTLGLHSGDDAWGNPVKYVPYDWFGYDDVNFTMTTKETICDTIISNETLFFDLSILLYMGYTTVSDDCEESPEYQAYIIASGGPEDRDGVNGLFDLCNGIARPYDYFFIYDNNGRITSVGFYYPSFNDENKIWDTDYDDMVRSFSIDELQQLVSCEDE